MNEMRECVRARLFGSAPEEASPPPELPTAIGRYRVLQRIGRGGMSVVFEATDPLLDRKVAVKVMADAVEDDDTRGRARLLREAQALARLSHPSVVQVYEVGTFEDQVFIAMEHVRGTTLRTWQTQTEPSWQAVLRTYVAAGGGLAAAHRAGIVHRDFKPDNVLVRHDGAIRVIDFGLARSPVASSPPPREIPGSGAPADALAPLTRSGALLGTPAYMAPEQWRGESTDARTDQFSFCVALYEALYGYRPFAGQSVASLATAVLAGQPEPPPRYTDVPEQVWQVLERGLACDPAQRFSSLDALLAELPQEAPPWTRRTFGALGAVLVVVGGLSWWHTAAEATERRAKAAAVIRDFRDARLAGAAEHLQEHQAQRSSAERWNAAVLEAAAAASTRSPTQTLAWLGRLDPAGAHWAEPARRLANAALESAIELVRLPTSPAATRVALSADGQTLAWAGPGPEIWRRDQARAAVSVRRNLRGKVVDLTSSSNGEVLLAADDRRTVAVWRGDEPAITWSVRHPIVAVAVDPSGRWAALADPEGALAWYDLARPDPSRPERREATALGTLDRLGISPDGSSWAAATEGVVHVDRGVGPRVLDARFASPIDAIRWAIDGSAFTLLQRDGQLTEVDAERLEPGIIDLPRAPWREAPVLAAALSEARDVAVVLRPDGRIERWRLRGAEPQPLAVPPEARALVAFDWDEARERLLVGSETGMLLSVVPAGGVVRPLRHLSGGIDALAVSPSGRWAAALGQFNGIAVVDLHRGSDVQSLSPGAFLRPPLAWSDDERFVAAQICDAAEQCAVAAHARVGGKRFVSKIGPRVEALAFSSTGRHLVALRREAAGSDHVEVYDLGLGQGARPSWPAPPPRRIVAAGFVDPSSLRVVTHEGSVATWWHWAWADDLLVPLMDGPANRVVSAEDRRSFVVQTASASTWWAIERAWPEPWASFPRDALGYRIERDGHLQVETATGWRWLDPRWGTARPLEDERVLGVVPGAGRLSFVADQTLRWHPDPTPRSDDTLLAWLRSATAVPLAATGVP